MNKIFHDLNNTTHFDQTITTNDSDVIDLGSDMTILPGGFQRLGSDLSLTSQDGENILIQGFFNHEPQGLNIGDGFYPFAQIKILSGTQNPGEYTQAAPNGSSEAIGLIETLEGDVNVLHADGTTESLSVGSPIFEGDVIRTASTSSVSMTFMDESTFSLDEDGEIVLDEMVYDPQTGEGSFASSLTSGAFSFVSGQIAKLNPEAMEITTPVATIGIRGTQGVIKQDPSGGMQAALLEEPGGFTGELVLSNGSGNVVVLNQPYQASVITSFTSQPSAPRVIGMAEIAGSFGTRALVAINQARINATQRRAERKQAEAQEKQAEAEEKQAEADALSEQAAQAEGAEADALAEQAAQAQAEADALLEQAAADAAEAQAAAAELALITDAQASLQNQFNQLQGQIEDFLNRNSPQQGNQNNANNDVILNDRNDNGPQGDASPVPPLPTIQPIALKPIVPTKQQPGLEEDDPVLDGGTQQTTQKVTWTNASEDSLWSNAQNWNAGALPTSNDDVQLNDAYNKVVFNSSAGTVNIKSLTSAEDLDISGGSLLLDGASSFDAGTTLTLTAGTLGGAGSLTQSGAFSWAGGTLSGGAMSVAGTATLSSGTFTLDRSLTLNGTIDASAAQTLTGTGKLTLGSSATWDMDSDAINVALDVKGILKSTSGTNSVDGSVTNTGTILANETLVIKNANETFTSTSGTISVAASKVMEISCGVGGTVNFGSGTTLSGSGTLQFSGATNLNLTSDLTLTNSILNLNTGDLTVGGLGKLIFNTDYSLTGSAQANDTYNAALQVLASKTLKINSSGGAFTQTFGGGITNNGTLELFNGGANINITTSVTNTGTIISSGSAGYGNKITGSITNTGTIHADAEDITIANTGKTLDTSSGTLQTTSTQVIIIDGGTTIFGSSTSLTGYGVVKLQGTQTLNIGSGFTHNPGSVELQLNGVITVTGNGEFKNMGTMNLLQNGSTFNVAFKNQANSTVTIKAATMDSFQAFNAGLTNEGTLNLYGAGYSTKITMGGSSVLSNTGTIATTGTAGGSTHTIFGEFQNRSGGTLNVTANSLTISGETLASAASVAAQAHHANSGTINIASGMTLTVLGASFTNNANGVINITTGGTLDTTGVGSYVNNGDLNTGQSPGTGYIVGDFAQSDSGTIISELAGTTPGTGHDVLDVSGNLHLDGTLDIVLYNGYQPQAGDVFDVILYGSKTGSFDQLTGSDLGNGMVMNAITSSDRVTLEVMEINQNGSAGIDTLTGTNEQDVIHAHAGDDTIDGGGGADLIFGGDGDDQIILRDSSFLRVDGGDGIDRLNMDFDLDLSALNGDQIDRVEILDLTGGTANTLNLTADSVMASIDGYNSLLGSEDGLIINRDSDDLVTFLDEGWTTQSTTTTLDSNQDGVDESYTTYAHSSGAVVLVENVL